MLVPLGEMREPVRILTPIRTVDEAGGEVWGYGESECIFMSIRGLSGSESLQFGQVNAKITNVGFGHYIDLFSISAKERIKMVETGQEFDIAGPPVNDPKKAWTKLTLVYRENP